MSARRLALYLAALLATASLAAAVPAPAVAQDDEATTAETEPTGDEGSGTNAEERNDDDALVALGVLAFGALALAMTLLYMNAWRQSSAELIKETLAATGQLPDYESVAAAVPEPGERGVRAQAVQVRIRGPALAHVGRQARFRATRDGEPAEAEWTVEPADACRAEPTRGEQTMVTPARLGPFTVRATVGGITAAAHVVAVAARRPPGRIPFVGVGYGGVTIAINALTPAAASTAYGKLDGAALVALAGAVVGYFFVEARGQQDGPSGNAGPGAAADGGGEAPV